MGLSQERMFFVGHQYDQKNNSEENQLWKGIRWFPEF
jgi:hypothetical protein